jgi:uncharacterized protein (UPF0335 family)
MDVIIEQSDQTSQNSGAAHLRSMVERIERLDEEIKSLKQDQKDIYAEAKSAGYDTPAMRALIRMRAEDQTKRETREMLVATYAKALGMLADLPLGQAAIERV